MDTEQDINKLAGVVLYTDEHEFILQLRTADAQIAPNKICLFGGHLQVGEQPLEAALREMHEETSLPIEQLEFIGELPGFTEPDARNIPQDRYVYAALVKTRHFEVREGKSAVWMTAQAALDSPQVLSGTKSAIEQFMKEKPWH